MSHKLYQAFSLVLALTTFTTVLHIRPNSYSAFVMLSQSNFCILVLINTFLCFMMSVTWLAQKALFGELRAVERDDLYERTWFMVTETCLAMTLFRDVYSVRVIIMFAALISLKMGAWIVASRVEWMNSIVLSRREQIRMASALTVLLLIAFAGARYAILDVLYYGPSLMVMLAFEYAILTVLLLSSCIKYVQRRMFPVPEERATSMVDWWIDTVTDFFKLFLYLVFFSMVITYYGLPIHILRDVYLTFRSLISKVASFIRYKRATSDMEKLYENADAEDLEREGTCIVCREEMSLGEEEEEQPANAIPKKLACGHVLHSGCLQRWLEQQQTCPTCRRTVVPRQQRASTEPPVAREQPQAASTTAVPSVSPTQRQLLQSIKLPPGWGILVGQKEVIVRTT